MVSQITGISIACSTTIRLKAKKRIKAPHYVPFGSGMHRWSVDFPADSRLKGSVMRNVSIAMPWRRLLWRGIPRPADGRWSRCWTTQYQWRVTWCARSCYHNLEPRVSVHSKLRRQCKLTHYTSQLSREHARYRRPLWITSSDYNIYIANTLEILQCCTKPWMGY